MNELNFKIGEIQPLECYKEGWEIIKADYWLFFAICLLGGLIGGLTLYILLGAMVCGIFFSFLQKIDTGKVQLDDLWKGFKVFTPSFLVTLVIIIPMLFVYGIVYAPFIIAISMGSNLSGDEFMGLFIGAIAIDSIFVLAMVCFHTLLMFSFPLIIDRKLSAMQAMKTSAKAVWQNLAGVGGLIGIQFLLMLVGMLTCGLGFYFLTPIMIAGLAVGYRKVFPNINETNSNPPPPDAYENAGNYS